MGCVSSSTSQNNASTNTRTTGRVTAPSTTTGTHRIAPPASWDHPHPITREELDRLQADFWDSFTTGHARSRENIRVVADLLYHSSDYETASGILAAAEIQTPLGTLEMCYDSLGERYDIPLYCFSTPRNLITTEEAKRRQRVTVPHKGPVTAIQIKVRISSSKETLEQDINLTMNSNDTVRQLKENIHSQLSSGEWDGHKGSPNKWKGKGLPIARQRLMYRGGELYDEHHLQQAQIGSKAFVQVFVRPT